MQYRNDNSTRKISVVWDMETGDPDDYLTLLLLIDHPSVDLKAVTITPGSQWQVGLVRRTLDAFGAQIPVGAHNIQHPKRCVSKWHERVYGDIVPSSEAEDGGRLLCQVCDENTTLITGAALKNIGAAVQHHHEGSHTFVVGRAFIQGGFAGTGVVPDELQLDKFRGRSTCPTYNLNGDVASAFALLDHSGVRQKFFVSKNVCHRVYYDHVLHQRFSNLGVLRKNQTWIHQGMERYLRRHSDGKKFHDPLAACCAIHPDIGSWAEVELYREKSEWGARLKEGTNTWIIVDYDQESFVQTLLA